MPHPISSEPSWTAVGSPSKYTRPLLGSEILQDLAHLYSNGLGECCTGIMFKTSLSDQQLESRTRESLARIRFTAPIIACTIARGDPESPQASWVYSPLIASSVLHTWAADTLTVRRGPFDPEKVVKELNNRRLPYVHSDGHEQYIHLYLFVNNEGESAIFMHGTHSIMDARPTLRVLNLMLKFIVNPPAQPVESLSWGSEWERLPAGPITATGGLRENWEPSGSNLLQETLKIYANPTPTLSLHPSREAVKTPGDVIRVHDNLDPHASSRLAEAAKSHGFSLSHLFDAALALAVFAGNPLRNDESADSHFTFDPMVISQDKFLVPPHNGPSHFVAGLILVPVQVLRNEIPASGSPKDRLLAAMRLIKNQHDHYMQNPHLPHLLPAQVALHPPRQSSDFTNPYASTITNVGNIHDYLSSTFSIDGRESSSPVIKVYDVAIGQRLVWQRLMTHVWSLNSSIHLQIQASDVWDVSFLQDHLAEMKKQMLAILDGEGSSDGNIASTPEDVSTSSPPAFTEIPYPGYHLTNTIHHDTYPTIDPTKADLTGKIVFISGASQGLGKAMAMSFARSGASGIIIAARSMNLLDEVAIAMTEAAALVNRSPKILKLMLDVTDIATVENVAAEIRRVFGKLDVVINNAGRADNPQAVPLSMSDPDDWWNVWTVNIRGVYLVTRALLPLLTNNDADNKLIVNIASYVAHFASPLSSAYCIGKFALLRLTETIHLECAPHNISVLSVHPGVVLTDMTKDIPALMRSTLIDSPQLSADTLVWLAKERRDWLSGRYISSTWDMTELESMKEDITTGDKLKMRMVI